MALLEFEPLRIRAWLRTPVISDQWLPLDGILLYQAHREFAGGGPEFSRPGEYTVNAIGNLTFLGKKHDKPGLWYYRCSWAQWSDYIDGRDHWNKRFDPSFAYLIDFAGRRGSVNVASAQYKAYHMPLFYRAALWVEWYAYGNKTEIERLLSTLTHVGKKSSQGWGRVWRWEIESIQDDYSTWRDGRLMRGIPVEGRESVPVDAKIAYYGVRPSYWNRSNQMNLVMP